MGSTAILAACEFNNKDSHIVLIDRLLFRGAVITDVVPTTLKSVMHLLVNNCSRGLAKMMMRQRGVELNASDCHGRNPLFEAVENHNEPVVELLLSRGIPVNIRDDEGKTPLHCAATVSGSTQTNPL